MSLLQRLPGTKKCFLVLSAGRSGSTLLMQYLRSHPEITCEFTEPLNPDSLSSSGLRGPNISPSSLLNYVMAQLVSWRKRAGCKIFCQQLEFHSFPLARLLSALRDPPVIVLFREDMLATYVSLQMAFKTGVWYSQEETKGSPTAIQVDPEDFKRHVSDQRRRWRAALSAFTGRMRKRIHFLSYEDLIRDKDGSMERVFSFLRLPPCETVAYSKRQNPFHLRDTVTNYEEIESSIGASVLTKEWLMKCVE